MGHYSYSFVTENCQKLLKNMFLAMFTFVTSYSAQKYVLLVNEWFQIILDITQGALNTHDPI
jgi:hypothetical protein